MLICCPLRESAHLICVKDAKHDSEARPANPIVVTARRGRAASATSFVRHTLEKAFPLALKHNACPSPVRVEGRELGRVRRQWPSPLYLCLSNGPLAIAELLPVVFALALMTQREKTT